MSAALTFRSARCAAPSSRSTPRDVSASGRSHNTWTPAWSALSAEDGPTLGHMAAAVNALEPEMEALDDTSLTGRTAEFRTRVSNGEPLDDLMVAAQTWAARLRC